MREVTIGAMGRVILIGDLHGCLKEAEELLEKCEARPEDHVLFLGDLIDRGPDSAGCVNLAMRIEERQGKPACILGNHEEKMLFYEDIKARKGHVNVDIPTHIETRMQLRPLHYDYFRRMPKFIRFPEHNVVAVHAGVYPGRPIEKQTDRHLLHIQSIKPFDQHGNPRQDKDADKSMWPSRVPPAEQAEWKFWTHYWNGPERIAFGHSVLNKPLITDRVIGIDGGACFGLELWAYVLPDNQLISVKGRGKHDQSDMDRRGNPNRKLFIIDEEHGVGTY
jgi:hypothetical protein